MVALAEQIGQPYPHGEIHAPAEERKQSTRMLKLQCPACGYVIMDTSSTSDQSWRPLLGDGLAERPPQSPAAGAPVLAVMTTS